MSFWILAALLTVIPAALIASPLQRGHKKLALALIFVVPLLALAIYAGIGNPELVP